MNPAKLVARCTAPTPETRLLPREQRAYFTEDHTVYFDHELIPIVGVWEMIKRDFEKKWGYKPGSITNLEYQQEAA